LAVLVKTVPAEPVLDTAVIATVLTLEAVTLPTEPVLVTAVRFTDPDIDDTVIVPTEPAVDTPVIPTLPAEKAVIAPTAELAVTAVSVTVCAPGATLPTESELDTPETAIAVLLTTEPTPELGTPVEKPHVVFA
jgi:hypothetical protein